MSPRSLFVSLFLSQCKCLLYVFHIICWNSDHFIVTDFPRFNVALCLCAGASLAVCAAVTDGVLDMKSVVGADILLPCTAELKPGVQYVAVRWYKVRLERVFSLRTKFNV